MCGVTINLAQPTLIAKARRVHWHSSNATTVPEIAGSNLIQAKPELDHT
jgi:hypothetical protein